MLATFNGLEMIRTLCSMAISAKYQPIFLIATRVPNNVKQVSKTTENKGLLRMGLWFRSSAREQAEESKIFVTSSGVANGHFLSLHTFFEPTHRHRLLDSGFSCRPSAREASS
jgi:hypothetical protein